MAKILVVEDDLALSLLLKETLQKEHYQVDAANNGDVADDYLKAFEYDLLILDRNLPGVSGVDFCRCYRRNSSGPVLMLTGMGSITDKEEGFEAGADDYLTKPFHMKELLLRVKALLRRPSEISTEVTTIGTLVINTRERNVSKAGKMIELTPREFDVLEYFVRHPNQIVAVEALLRRVWSTDSDATEHAVYVCINRLRKSIDSGEGDSFIKTVRGVGYRFEVNKAH